MNIEQAQKALASKRVVNVKNQDGVEYTATITELHRNRDGALNKLARIKVVDKKRSFHYKGKILDIGIKALS